jgi:pyruvyl transferase EpsO
MPAGDAVANDTEQSFPARMTERIACVLGSVLEPSRPVALINYPNHQNPGDNAIWLGTQAVLRSLNVPVGYTSNWSSFSAPAMRSAIGDGPLLLNGGGNFGDLYAGQQMLREHILEHCKERRIVQLPQSIYFREERNLERMRRLCAGHPDFTLMVRERRSQEIARTAFDVPVLMCPDMAFGLGALARPAGPRTDLLWIGRADAERVERSPPPRDVPSCDWLTADLADDMSEPTQRVLRLNRRLIEFTRGDADGAGRRQRALSWTFGILADAWVRRGLDLVSSATVLVTDRLHAHVFAILLGVPHVVLDNSYGKVRSTFETWTHDSALATWASTTEEALQAAAPLLSRHAAIPWV